MKSVATVLDQRASRHGGPGAARDLAARRADLERGAARARRAPRAARPPPTPARTGAAARRLRAAAPAGERARSDSAARPLPHAERPRRPAAHSLERSHRARHHRRSAATASCPRSCTWCRGARPISGEFAGRPPNSLLDEALTPVDRDVFRRQNRYYAALAGRAQRRPSHNLEPPAAAPGASRPKDEK